MISNLKGSIFTRQAKLLHKPVQLFLAGGLAFTLGSFPLIASAACEVQNDDYEKSAKTCSDLQKTSDAANVALSLALATLNPVAIGAAISAATSAALAAKHNCEISENKEKTVIDCIKTEGERYANALKAQVDEIDLNNKSISLFELWEAGNLQQRQRLALFLKSEIDRQKAPLLLSKEWLRHHAYQNQAGFQHLRQSHRDLKERVEKYQNDQKLSPVVQLTWE